VLSATLRWHKLVEAVLATVSCAAVAGLLMADVVGREVFGQSFLRGQQLAVYGAILAGFMGLTLTTSGLKHAIFAIHRELKLIDFFHTAVDTAKLLGMLFPLVAVALSIKTILTIEEIPDALALRITAITDDKIMFLLAVNVLLLIVGCLFDVISAILILAPLLLIPAVAYGVDRIHLGVIMVINLEIGFLTPPLGLNLIVAMTAFRENFLEICRAVLPFVGLILLVLLIVTYVPDTALLLLR